MDNNTLEYESALMARDAWYYYYCDMTQQDIAEKLGYSSASSFIRAFRQVYGISPSAYRRGKRTARVIQDD